MIFVYCEMPTQPMPMEPRDSSKAQQREVSLNQGLHETDRPTMDMATSTARDSLIPGHR
jgi:hypothetical protein